jgi:hypothetical protein
MAKTTEDYLKDAKVKIAKARPVYQGKIRAGMDPDQAERETMRECFPQDKNWKRTLHRWTDNGLWPPVESDTEVSRKVIPDGSHTTPNLTVIPQPSATKESSEAIPNDRTKVIREVTPEDSSTEVSSKVTPAEAPLPSMTQESPDSMTAQSPEGMTGESPYSITEEPLKSMTPETPLSMTITDAELTERISEIVDQKLKEIFAARAESEDEGKAKKFTISMPETLYERLTKLKGTVSGRIAEAVRIYLNLKDKTQEGA